MKIIRVAEVYRLYGVACASIPEDTSLADVISRFALEPGLRGVFLVDFRQRFSSMISRIDLMRWAHLQLSRGKGMRKIAVSEFFRIVDAKKAKDLARRGMRSFSVRENDTLQTALERMLDYEEDIIPVLDEDGKIIGDLRLSEVLLKVLEMGKHREET